MNIYTFGKLLQNYTKIVGLYPFLLIQNVSNNPKRMQGIRDKIVNISVVFSITHTRAK